LRDGGATQSATLKKQGRSPLRRPDQAAAMAIVAVSLLAMLGYWLVHGGHRGEVIDLDRAPRREVEFQLDVNRAGEAELALLPNIGKVLAERIVRHRQAEGPFADHDELLQVKGIGPKTLARIKPYLLPIQQRGDALANRASPP
jgi:competence protein ComEA